MKKHLLFVGNKFIHNEPLRRYIFRKIIAKIGHVDKITYFNESDKALFLHLEEELRQNNKMLVITSKNSFSVVGKLISTVTSDNQVVVENMLIPSRTTVYENDSYLLKYNDTIVNVIQGGEGKNFPPILIEEEECDAKIHLFDEEIQSAKNMLDPLAQSLDVKLELTEFVPGWIQLHIQSRRYGNISQFIASAKQLLPNHIITASNIAAYIIETLLHKQKKITFAESCTGGLLAYFLTHESGASAVFEGSLVTYSNVLKSNWLAVDDQKLETYGAVSPEVVEEMSEGALNVSYADYALSISGIAGPEGGSEYKPVGTVCIGARSKTHALSETLHFEGDRNYIQEQSVLYAVKMLLLLDKALFFKK